MVVGNDVNMRWDGLFSSGRGFGAAGRSQLGAARVRKQLEPSNGDWQLYNMQSANGQSAGTKKEGKERETESLKRAMVCREKTTRRVFANKTSWAVSQQRSEARLGRSGNEVRIVRSVCATGCGTATTKACMYCTEAQQPATVQIGTLLTFVVPW